MDVFPAPAGINRQFVVRDPVRACVPRASGDKPRLWNLWRSLVLCSPRQRDKPGALDAMMDIT
ncbi:hypothetical protein OHD37_14850 [Escherichia coli]|nr:hypothetical protein [Escherichia coli]